MLLKAFLQILFLNTVFQLASCQDDQLQLVCSSQTASSSQNTNFPANRFLRGKSGPKGSRGEPGPAGVPGPKGASCDDVTIEQLRRDYDVIISGFKKEFGKEMSRLKVVVEELRRNETIKDEKILLLETKQNSLIEEMSSLQNKIDFMMSCEVPNITNVDPTRERIADGETIRFQCSSGFYSTGEMKRVCKRSKWHPSLTEQPIDCFQGCEMPNIANGTVNSEDKTFLRSGESVEFECDKGFSTNKNRLTCNDHDISPRSTRCYSDCKSLFNVELVKASMKLPVKHGELVEVLCDDGLYNQDIVQCNDGFINATSIKCKKQTLIAVNENRGFEDARGYCKQKYSGDLWQSDTNEFWRSQSARRNKASQASSIIAGQVYQVGIKRGSNSSPWKRANDNSVVGHTSDFQGWWESHPYSGRYVLLTNTNGHVVSWVTYANSEGYPFICETFEQ